MNIECDVARAWGTWRNLIEYEDQSNRFGANDKDKAQSFIESLLGARHYSMTLRCQLVKSSRKKYYEVGTIIPFYKWKTEAERG